MKHITVFFCSLLLSTILNADEVPPKAPPAPTGATTIEPKAPSPATPTVSATKPSQVAPPPKPAAANPKPMPVSKKAPTQAQKTPQGAATSAPLGRLPQDIQETYEKTNSATFDFEQSYKSPFVPMSESSKGQVFFKARNMLWRYNEPSDRKKEFYIEGRKFTYHLVSDKQAFTHNCFEKDTLSAAITFLWGHGNLKNSFDIKPFQGPISDPKLKWLTLIPKEKNAPVKSISLGVDPKTAIVVESIVTDLSDGVNSFRFSNFKVNPNIPPKTFQFVAGPGVKVQPMPNVVCPSSSSTPPVPTKAPVSNATPPAPAKAPPPNNTPAKAPPKP